VIIFAHLTVRMCKKVIGRIRIRIEVKCTVRILIRIRMVLQRHQSNSDPKQRLEIMRHFFSQRVIEDWNKIPASLK
jgi:hypothetical protein